jgi:hypothetical protein
VIQIQEIRLLCWSLGAGLTSFFCAKIISANFNEVKIGDANLTEYSKVGSESRQDRFANEDFFPTMPETKFCA